MLPGVLPQLASTQLPVRLLRLRQNYLHIHTSQQAHGWGCMLHNDRLA